MNNKMGAKAMFCGTERFNMTEFDYLIIYHNIESLIR